VDIKHRVLIVDDDTGFRKTLSGVLRVKGYVPIAVGQGKAALDRIQAEMPAVALIDLKLEDMPGLELMKKIKKRCPDTECILITGYASQASAIEAVNLGAYGYLPKPYDMEEVLVMIRRAIERREAKEALRESEDRYRDLVEHSHDLICTHDLQGQILSVNQGAAQLLGYEPSALLKKNIRDILAPEVRDEFDTYLATIRREGAARGLMLIQTSAGEKRIWEYNNTLRTKGVATPIVRGMAHDITERKQGEMQARRRAENMVAVSKLAIKLADARPDTEPFELIAEEIKSLTSALATSVSTYDAKSQNLTVEYIALRSPILSRANKLLGRNMVGMQIPVGPELLKRMLAEVVTTSEDLSEVSFGVIPQPVGAAIQRATGIGYFTGLALYSGDELEGTVLIALPKGRPPLPVDMMKAFAHVVTASLRRRQMEKVLWESEERYRTLVENVPIGIYRNTLGPTGRFLMANPAFLRMLGFNTEEELKQVSVADLYTNPGERKAFSDNLLAQGSATGVEMQLKKKDGTLMWGSVTARVVHDEQSGGTAYFDCTIEDITERKEVEEQIRQNAARAEALAAISQVLAESGLDYQAALDTVARRTAELIGDGCVVSLVSDDGQWLHPVALYHPNQEALAFMRHLLISTPQRVGEGISGRVAQSGEPALVPAVPQDQIRTIFKPEYLPYLEQFGMHSLLIVPLHAGSQVIGTMGLMRDEPGRPHTTDDRLFLQSIADRAALAIANARLYEETSRRNRELELLNRVIAASASELEPEMVLETACRELAQAFDVPQAVAALLNEQKTMAVVVVAEYSSASPEHRRVEGRRPALNETIPTVDIPAYQYLLTHKAPLVVDDAQNDPLLAPLHDLLRRRGIVSLLILPLIVKGEVMGSLGLEDVKPHRFSAQEISLAWSVADQASGVLARARLDQERQRLEEQYYQSQKMDAIGQLTAGIAHDFNNLLTAVNGFTELLGLQLPPDDPLQEYVGKVLDSGQRAADLVGHLLAFARKQILEPQVLDLNAVVAQVEVMLRRIIGEHIELKTILAPDLWPVKVDAAHIEQVIVNLAVNARDAMPGGGKLTIETANVVLDEAYVASHLGAKPGDYVLLAVSDTGVGMSQEVQAHIFEPFFTTKKRGEGTGLGLATVYGIVKQSDGDIQVYSEEGHGTSFKIYLPSTKETVQPLHRPGIEEKLPPGNETILLVEDDAGVRDLARLLLQERGYSVLEAKNGQEALRLAAGHSGPIHLLLADVVMPGMNGMSIAESLIKAHPGLKILFMSGYTNGAIAYQDRFKPDAAFLQKPFSNMALARKVRQVLDAPRQRQPAIPGDQNR
jgi:PAS domain S-box-containing protein